MTARTHVNPTIEVGRGAVTHDTALTESGLTESGLTGSRLADSWIELVVAEEEWVRREFDEIVAAGWDGPGPPCPDTTQGTHEPRRRGPRGRPTRPHPSLDRTRPHSGRARERGPPV